MEDVAGRTLVLAPKAAYWRALGPFAVMAPFAAVFACLTAYDYASTGFRPGDSVIGAWILLGFFGIGALIFFPGALSSRKPVTFTVDGAGVRLARGSREQRIPWADMSEVTWGPRRVRLGKTSAVGEALRIRGSSELLPIEVDEVNYRVDHDVLVETGRLVVDVAQKLHTAVIRPASPEW